MAIQIRTSLAEPDTGGTFVPHKPARPEKAEGGKAFTLVSDDMRRYSDAEWGLLEALRSVHDDVDTLLDIDDPFADPIVVRSAAGTTLTVDWRDDAPEGPTAQLGLSE